MQTIAIASLILRSPGLQLRYSKAAPVQRLKFSMASPATLAAQAAMSTIDLSKYDPEQSKLMEERCILVDEQDNAIGAMDKKTCMLYIVWMLSVILLISFRSFDGKHQ